VEVAAIAIDDAVESLPWKEIHELREQRFANVHRALQLVKMLEA
jgi:hypothetical protein